MDTNIDEIEKNFEVLKDFLVNLSNDIEKDYINNKDYPRFKRLHEWYQNKKDLDILVHRMNHVESNTIFMLSDSHKWKGVKGPKWKFNI